MTGKGFRGGKEYNYQFTHPPLRLTHKVLAMCFLGHGEVKKISQEDLKLLWTLSQECELIPNWAGIFISSCHKARTNKKEKISMGGMISLLIQALLDDISANPRSKDPPLGEFIYDLMWLRNNRYLFPTDNGYQWKSGQYKEHIVRLPLEFVYGLVETFRVVPDDAVTLGGPGLALPPQPEHYPQQEAAGPSGSQSYDPWQERFYSDMTSGFMDMRAGFEAMTEGFQ